MVYRVLLLALLAAGICAHEQPDQWEERSDVLPELTVAKSYVRVSSPLVALEASQSGKHTKLVLHASRFDELRSKIAAGHQHIRLTDLGVEGEQQLDVSPFDVFTKDAVIESDDSSLSLIQPDMVFLRGKVTGDDDSFVTLQISRHGAFGTVQSNGRTWQLGPPRDRSAHAVLTELSNDGSEEEDKAKLEAIYTELSMPVQIPTEIGTSTLAQTKARLSSANFDSTGTEPVLTLALECDKACRDLFQDSGECLAEIPLLIEEEDSFEEQSPAARKLAGSSSSSPPPPPPSTGTPTGAPTRAPTGAPTAAGAAASDKSTSCSGWVGRYECTQSFNFPTGETETLQEHCPESCGPTGAPTAAPTYAPGDGVAGCTHPAATYLASVIAGASSIYSNDIGVTLQIQYMKVWSGTSPYDQGTASLDAFRSAYNGVSGQQDASIAHLFTGIVEGGLAYVGTACNNQGYNTGVSSIRGTWDGSTASSAYNWDLIVTAHEMGHNVGSGHTHDTDSYNPAIDQCVDSTGSAVARNSAACVRGTIMSYCHLCGGTANIDMTFADRVKTQIKSSLNGRSCNLNLS